VVAFNHGRLRLSIGGFIVTLLVESSFDGFVLTFHTGFGGNMSEISPAFLGDVCG
jgi:hypothetical protein